MSLFLPAPVGAQTSLSYADARPAATTGTLITADSTSHTLGTKVELFASTSHDTYWVKICVHATASNGAQTDQLLNIYTGAAGVEQILIPSLVCGGVVALTTNAVVRCFEFPLFIPRGTRISAAVQALIGSDDVRVLMELQGGGAPFGWCGQGVEAVGANTAASQGTSVVPGGAAEGTFTNIGTTVKEFKYVLPMIQATMTDTTTGAALLDVDIGVGDALYKDLRGFLFNVHTTEGTGVPLGGRGRFTLIPAGTALQLRIQSHTTGETQHDCVIYGVY